MNSFVQAANDSMYKPKAHGFTKDYSRRRSARLIYISPQILVPLVSLCLQVGISVFYRIFLSTYFLKSKGMYTYKIMNFE